MNMKKTVKIGNKQYKVYRSDKPGKKYKINVKDKTIHFGAKGYTIAPGTKKGDNYCARSSGIKDTGPLSPNQLSRQMWRCKGKISIRNNK